MKRWIFLLFAAFASACATTPAATNATTPGPGTNSNAPQFAYCPPAKFANCTVAKCQLQADGHYTC